MDELLSPLPFVGAAVLIGIPAVLWAWEDASSPLDRHGSPWARGGWFISVAMFLALCAAIFAIAAGRGLTITLYPLAVALVLMFPWTVVRYILIPLGLWRAAIAFSPMCAWLWRGDIRAGRLISGAWALSRQRRPSQEGMRVLERMRDHLAPLGGTAVVGAALLESVRGRQDMARQLMTTVEDFDSRTRSPFARLLAREWLVAEAISRADWVKAAQLGHAPGRRSRATRFLGAAAARVADLPGGPTDGALWRAYLLSPNRLAHLGLLRRALRRAPVLDLDTPAPPKEETAACRQLKALAAAWDERLADPRTRSYIAARGLALGSRDADQVFARMRDDVERRLAALARKARLDLSELVSHRGPGGDSLRRTADALRADLLDDLELACESLERRVQADRALPPFDELREWASVRSRYDQLRHRGGPPVRRLAFASVHEAMCAHAVWLWEQEGEGPLANAIFRWLLDEAVVSGDEQAVEVQRRNVLCGA